MPKIRVGFSERNILAVGQSYNLSCNVFGANSLHPTIAYNWTKDDSTQTQVGTNSSTLFFSLFRLSDAGYFTCDVTISSDYLDNVITASTMTLLTVQSESGILCNKSATTLVCALFAVPHPVSVQVESIGTWGKPLFLPSGTVTNVTLTCTVEMSPTVNVPVSVETKWNGPDAFKVTNSAMNVSTNYTSMATVSSLSHKKAGEYRCRARVTSPMNMLITGEGTNENTTTVTLCKLYEKCQSTYINSFQYKFVLRYH